MSINQRLRVLKVMWHASRWLLSVVNPVKIRQKIIAQLYFYFELPLKQFYWCIDFQQIKS